MKDGISIIGKYFAYRKEYYNNSAQDIAKKNLQLLRLVSLATSCLVALFIVVTPAFLPQWKVTLPYILFLISMLAFVAFSAIYIHLCKEFNNKTITYSCILFIGTLNTFLIIIDVFAYPNLPATFLPMVLIVLPVVFIYKFSTIFPILLISEIVFTICTLSVKATNIANHDAFRCAVGLAFAFVVDFIIGSLRVDDYLSKKKYKKLSRIDSLTSIYNKVTCENAVRNYLSAASSNDIYAMLIMDIDNFKHVNDLLGHTMGDRVLEEFGNILLNVFGPRNIVGRFGGDEFLVLITDMQDTSVAGIKCSQFQNSLKDIVSGGNVAIRCSIGAIIVNRKAVTYGELFQLADKALYEAKIQGKNKFIIHNYDKTDLTKPIRHIMLSIVSDHKELLLLRNTFYSYFTIKEDIDFASAVRDLERYKEEIAVIFIDFNNNSINFDELLKIIKSDLVSSQIPTIALTNSESDGDAAILSGASEFLCRPIDVEVAKLRVKNILMATKNLQSNK